jgi:dienelactone hydrolase
VGIAILLMAVVAEVAFAAVRIRTRSRQSRLRNIGRIGALAGFLLLLVLQLITWGPSYYLLGTLLLARAVMGAVQLVRRRDGTTPITARRVTLTALGMTALLFVATLPAITFPAYSTMPTTGQYAVATADYTYTDQSRAETYTTTGDRRKVNVRIWYPDRPTGRYPLVVFSPGAISEKLSNTSLMEELASHGYVAVSIDHPFQSLYTTDADGHTTLIDQGYLSQVSAENARADRQQSYRFYKEWMTLRMGDIDFVIDHMVAEAGATGTDAAYQRVDPTSIGVMGHSLGGSAALGIGRARHDVKAVMALESPFMYDITGVTAGEFTFTPDPYPVPVLNVYSDTSWSHLGEWPQYAENNRVLTDPGPTASTVHIRGTGHLGLTDLAIVSPLLTRLLNGQASTADPRHTLETINKVGLQFFDTHLKGTGRFTSGGTY